MLLRRLKSIYKKNFSVSYDSYEYSDFWKGRDYEDQSDKIAVSKLLSMINGSHEKIIDIGAGMGRMALLYEKKWNEFVLFDFSKHQINEARENIEREDIFDSKKAQYAVGAIESIPFPNASFDTALCVRTFHYVFYAGIAIGEISRILKPEGYFILEIPNKLHFKNRALSILRRRRDASTIFSRDPINIAVKDNVNFLNHNPKTIIEILKSNNFEIVKVLSASNFRFPLIKRIFPIELIVKFEKITQEILASFYFGPSIYFLAKKSK